MIRSIFILILLINLNIIFEGKVFAATYYIDFNAGNDSNTGTIEAPWKTMPGTRNVNDTDWMSNDWGNGTINNVHKVTAGTIFKIKSGSTHNSSTGGYILITSTYYANASAANLIKFTVDETWGTGNVTFDGSGITIPQSLIHIQRNGIEFDGVKPYGIVIQNSPLSGVRVGTSSILVQDVSFRYVKFFNNGKSILTDSAGAGHAHLHFRYTTGGSISNIEIDGNKTSCSNGCFINGFLGGESYTYARNLMVTDSIAHDLKGDLTTDDSGIGFKAYNSQVTLENVQSYNNLKGFDLGELSGNNVDIVYKILNCAAWNNSFGINLNSSGKAYSGKVTWYLINNIIRDNSILGSNIYAGPFTIYMVHNIYDNNGTGGSTPDYGNIGITADPNDIQKINAYLYNNIFYKPAGGVNLLEKRWVQDSTDLNLYSDYNSWVQRASDFFSYWSYFISPAVKYLYGVNGPGHSSGDWYNFYGANSTPPLKGIIGHYHTEANSKGTGANDSNLPPFWDIASHNYKLIAPYSGTDLSQKPWYIPEMGKDRDGLCRVGWDIGAYEYAGVTCTIPNPPSSLIIAP